MFINQNINETITIESIEESLLASEQIISPKWLAHEETKESSDPILWDGVSMSTDKQVSQMIREGKTGMMHPIAEAIIVGKKVRQFHKQNGVILGSNSLGRLLSIRDIVKRSNRVNGFNSRIPRLFGTQWKSVLYELLTATAYSDFAKTVLIEEDDSKKPDIRVDCAVPFYVECKAKLQYEDAVSRFKWRVRKEALGAIYPEIKKCRTGLMIQVDIHDDTCISKLPIAIKDMIASGVLQKNILGACIKATPSASGLLVLPKPMSTFSSETWDFLFGFKEWNNWHEMHTAGNFHYIKGSPLIATAVESPIILCFRSTKLASRSQNILQTVKDACRNQFKKYIPGVLHININTGLYGIGDKTLIESIVADLSKDASYAMNEYSRLSAILFDIITPPLRDFTLKHRRLTVVSENPKAKNIALPLIPGICLS